MSIQQSRLKLFVVAALAAALTLVLAFLAFVSAYLPSLWSFIGLSLFAPVGLALAVVAGSSALALAQPGTLTADGREIVHRTWRGARRIAWEDVEDVFVLTPENRLRSPGVRLKNGRVVSFGRCWEKTAEEVVEGMRGGTKP